MTVGPSVAIVGLGVNNRPLVPYWIARGTPLVIADRRPPAELTRELAPYSRARIQIYGGPDYLEQLAADPSVGVAYLTPGMIKDVPQIRQMVARGVRLTCETDLFLSRVAVPVLGVTGSAGKTTTTTIIGEGLRRSGIETAVGGNIGRSLLPEVDDLQPPGWAVLELSSFQLDLVEHSPTGAIWLNLAPNHLDIHGSMEAYALAKRRIVEFQDAERDWVILPFEDASVLSVVGSLGGRRFYVSLDSPVPRGCYLESGVLWWREHPAQAPQRLVAADQVILPGRHMLFNFLAAAAAIMLAGGESSVINELARTFRGVPHRLEEVARDDGVIYINDSIATAPDRTMAALMAVSGPIVLIAGGYDKGLDYAELGRKIQESNVRAVILVGQTAAKIGQGLDDAKVDCVVQTVSGFDEAVSAARALARPGDTVLLSPASASYDMFSNFEERGQRFRQLVTGRQ